MRRSRDANGVKRKIDSRRTATILLIRRSSKIAAVAGIGCVKLGCFAIAHKLLPGSVHETESFPRQLRLALEKLGPTFVKLGQLLSTRSDLTSPEVQRELSKLQDHAPSIPARELVEVLERTLESQYGAHFATLEKVPTACGSIAQVHKATLHSGEQVAVKIRRPGVREIIESDIWVLGKLVRLVSAVSSRARAYGPVAILDEFASLLRAETDFISEATNLEAVGRTFAMNDSVTIPRVVTDLSSESVLVMDWLEGIPLSHHESLETAGADRAGLARAILKAYSVMIFKSDRFQADPHPGNLIAVGNDRIGLVDFGEVGSVGPTERSALMQMMAAVITRDGVTLAQAVLSVSRTARPVDTTEFGTELSSLLEASVGATLTGSQFGEILTELLNLVRRHAIVLSSDLAILIKTLLECEGTARELEPTMSMLALVEEISGFESLPPSAST